MLPYQLRLIRDNSRYLAVEKAVRIGMTWAHSYKSSIKRTFRDPRLKPINEIFASKNRLVAGEYMMYHRKWAEAWNQFHPNLIDLFKWTTERAKYPGGDIVIVSSDPDAFRGMEGDVTLDEFAYHERQDALFSTAQSRTQWLDDGQVSLISSHSHPETVFARLVNDYKADKSKSILNSCHRVTLPEAVAQGLALKVPGAHRAGLRRKFEAGEILPEAVERVNQRFIENIRRSCLSEDDYAREYLCEPAKLSALVGGDEYDRCILESHVPEILAGRYGELFVGVDCGVKHDLTVFWALQRGYNAAGDSCYRTVCVKGIRNTPFPVQAQMLSPLLKHEEIGRGLIDQGVQGHSLAMSVKDYTGDVIQPFAFTGPRKAEMYERLRAFVQMRRISLSPDADVKSDFLSVRRVAHEQSGTKGGVRYDAGTRSSHGDYFAACALALHAAEAGSSVMNMLGAPEEAGEPVAV